MFFELCEQLSLFGGTRDRNPVEFRAGQSYICVALVSFLVEMQEGSGFAIEHAGLSLFQPGQQAYLPEQTVQVRKCHRGGVFQGIT